MSIYEDDLIERVGMSQQEACDELEIEQFKANLSIINEDNIHAAFEVYTKAEIVQMILNDDVAIRVDECEISQCVIQLELVKNEGVVYGILFNGASVEFALKEIANQKLNNLLALYEISA